MEKLAIYGATSAIAMEVAKLYAAKGARLALVARDAAKLEALKGDLLVRGAAAVFCETADLANIGDQKHLIERVEAALEGGSDISLIAFGTLSDQKACERDFSAAQKEYVVNFLSPVSLLTELANRYEAKARGTLAVISSVAGDRGRQSNYIYGSAKGALTLFLQGLRNRLASKGVSVLAIKPGFVDTPMTAAFKKGPLFVKPDVIAKGIERAISRKRDVVYLPWFWLPIMTIIKAIPEPLFKRLKL